MSRFLIPVRNFLQSEDGPTPVEYALMLSMIMVACMNILSVLGHNVNGVFSKVNSAMS